MDITKCYLVELFNEDSYFPIKHIALTEDCIYIMSIFPSCNENYDFALALKGLYSFQGSYYTLSSEKVQWLYSPT